MNLKEMNKELLEEVASLRNQNLNLSKKNKELKKQLTILNVSNCDFFCKETVLINGKAKCENQCDDCIGVENSGYTDTNGHIGSCC